LRIGRQSAFHLAPDIDNHRVSRDADYGPFDRFAARVVRLLKSGKDVSKRRVATGRLVGRGERRAGPENRIRLGHASELRGSLIVAHSAFGYSGNSMPQGFVARKRFEWKLRDTSLALGDRTLIVGILNITPDSFSDGGRYLDPDRAFARAVELEEQG